MVSLSERFVDNVLSNFNELMSLKRDPSFENLNFLFSRGLKAKLTKLGIIKRVSGKKRAPFMVTPEANRILAKPLEFRLKPRKDTAKARYTKYSPKEVEFCRRQTLVSLVYFFREPLLFLDQNPSEKAFRQRFSGRELVALIKHGCVSSVYRQRKKHEGKWYIISEEALDILNNIDEKDYKKMLREVFDDPLPDEYAIVGISNVP